MEIGTKRIKTTNNGNDTHLKDYQKVHVDNQINIPLTKQITE